MHERLNISTVGETPVECSVMIPKSLHRAFQLLAAQASYAVKTSAYVRGWSVGAGITAQNHDGDQAQMVCCLSGLFAGDEKAPAEQARVENAAERMAAIATLAAAAENHGERQCNDEAAEVVTDFHAEERPIEKERTMRRVGQWLTDRFQQAFAGARKSSILVENQADRYGFNRGT